MLRSAVSTVHAVFLLTLDFLRNDEQPFRSERMKQCTCSRWRRTVFASFLITVGAGKSSRMADDVLESEAGAMSLLYYGLEWMAPVLLVNVRYSLRWPLFCWLMWDTALSRFRSELTSGSCVSCTSDSIATRDTNVPCFSATWFPALLHDFLVTELFCLTLSLCKQYLIYLYSYFNSCYNISTGARGGAVGSGTALQAGRSRVRFPMLSLEFFIDIIISVQK
jgi:hypothetical protein